MSTLKSYITAKYGADIYKQTEQLQLLKKSVAKSKNQYIFLQKCEKHKIIPKSLRINSPVSTNRAMSIVFRFRFEILICLKNDAKKRYFIFITETKNLQENLKSTLDEKDYEKVEHVTEKAREIMLIRSKERLFKKFNILQNEFKNKQKIKNGKLTTHTKNAVLNLCNTEISNNQNDLLNLGPNFVPSLKHILYMNIIATTESFALKVE
ncbi:uncharacterized protein LOC136076307 [Hydra vulgaris]|uniref:Uncharacterized protein LOC136076307 n=1 Tax=Hydra vulgaris TaxID=6087 RepID=A0ABM4BAC0_HYDVU